MHFTPQGFVDAWGPLFFGAMVFGVAMDYTLFLLSAAKERYETHPDPEQAMIGSVGTSGRVVISAAAVMIAVFLTFALSGPLAPKEMGVILAVAVALDALIVRWSSSPSSSASEATKPGTGPPGSTGSSPTSASPTDPRSTHPHDQTSPTTATAAHPGGPPPPPGKLKIRGRYRLGRAVFDHRTDLDRRSEPVRRRRNQAPPTRTGPGPGRRRRPKRHLVAQRGWKVTAVDFSQVALDKGRRLAQGLDLADKLEWIQADVVTWTPPPDSYDLVVIAYLHLPAE